MKKSDEKYRPIDGPIELGISPIEGLGIFATEDIPKGTNLGFTHYFIRINEEQQIIRTPLGGFYNHSEEPNAQRISKFVYWNGMDVGRRAFKVSELITLRDIEKGEEIVGKYSMYDPTEKD